MRVVTCDKCYRDFQISILTEVKVLSGEQITRTYFECEHCGEQYNICFDNNVTEKIRSKIKQSISVINNQKSVSAHYTILKKIKRLQSKLEIENKKNEKKFYEQEKE